MVQFKQFAILRSWLRFGVTGCVAVLSLFPIKGWTLTPWSLTINTNNIKDITSYGANTGNSDNTIYIQSAINAAAVGGLTNSLRGGTVRVPAGTFFCGPLNLSNNVNFQIDAGAILKLLPYGTFPGAPYTGTVQPLINGSSRTNISITGLGMIDGQGADWWTAYGTNSSVNRPLLVNFSGCSKALLQDFTTTNPPVAHIVVKGANAGNISFIRIKLNAPATGAPNTDGIDFAETNALFQDCFISTGDDNIAIGSSASTSSDMLVTNCIFGAGHGLSIGSYTSGGVSNLTVINCSFDASGIRIKSSRDRGGIVQNLNYLNLIITNSDTPVNFYAYYEFGLGTLTTLTPQFVASYCLTNANPTPYHPPIFRDILVSNLTATLSSNVRNPFLLLGLPDSPISNVVFKAMSMTKPAGVNNPQIYNTTNVSFIDCNWVLPAGDKIQFWNADVVFTNSVFSTNLLILDGITYSNIGNTFEFDNAKATLASTNALAHGSLLLDRSAFVVSNNLTLTASTPLSFVVGTNPVMLAVKGNLKLGGVINITAGDGFGYGTYTLITNTGTMSGTLPILGSTPATFVCSLNTNTPKQLKLVVAPPDAPAAPVGLTATAYSGAVILQWSPVTFATGYNVKRSEVAGGPFVTVANVADTNYVDSGLTNGTTYYYVVSALNGVSESDDSSEVSAMPDCEAPPVPASITATAGNAQVSLVWPASFTATGYNIFRATSVAGPFTSLASVAGTNYTDATAANGTTYFYKISATNSCGESAASPALSARPVTASANYRINSGGSAVGSFAADNYYVGGGGTYATGTSINTNGLINPAPMSVYQTERYGNMAYTFGSLTAGASYTVRLHFAEIYKTSTGAREFNVYVNGSQVLTNFDIYASAGAQYKGLIREFLVSANGSGQIVVGYSNVVDNAKSSGIEILSASSAPVITSQPADQQVGTGVTAEFSVTATGAPNPGYQWIKDGTNLVGENGSTLTVPNVQAADQGTYCVLVTNSSGSVLSRYAALTIGTPGIIIQPTNQTVWAGGAVVFSVMATGASPLSYQWQQNDAPISGENGDTLTLDNAMRSMGGNYSVVITNSYGSVTSAVAVLTYSNTPPMALPMSVILTAGDGMEILWSDLATNWSDVDGDTVSLTGITLLTTNGVLIQTNGTSILYTNVQNVDDQISYTVGDSFGGSATGVVNIAVSIPAAPAAPVGVTALASNLQINLQWTPVSGATNYNLKRGTTSGSYPTVVNGLSNTNYQDSSLNPGTTYYYVVSSIGIGGEGTNSSEVSAAPLPSNQPTNIMVQVIGSQMQLSWPADHQGWRLLIQTNDLNAGLGTNWATVPGSTNVTSANIPIVTANGSIFLKLAYP